MELAPQTITLLIVNVLLLATFVAGVFMINNKKDADKEQKKWLVVIKNLGVFAVYIMIMCAQAYSVNCMIYGNCFVWSWVIAALIIVASLSHMGLIIYLIFKSRSA